MKNLLFFALILMLTSCSNSLRVTQETPLEILPLENDKFEQSPKEVFNINFIFVDDNHDESEEALLGHTYQAKVEKYAGLTVWHVGEGPVWGSTTWVQDDSGRLGKILAPNSWSTFLEIAKMTSLREALDLVSKMSFLDGHLMQMDFSGKYLKLGMVGGSPHFDYFKVTEVAKGN